MLGTVERTGHIKFPVQSHKIHWLCSGKITTGSIFEHGFNHYLNLSVEGSEGNGHQPDPDYHSSVLTFISQVFFLYLSITEE